MGKSFMNGQTDDNGAQQGGNLIIQIHFSAILFWAIVAVIFMFAAGITIIIAQTSGPPPGSEKIQDDAAAEVESPDRFNDLRKQYLDARHESIDWWLTGIAIVLGLFAIFAAVFGFVGFKEFQDFRDQARQRVADIEKEGVKVADNFNRIINEAIQNLDEAKQNLTETQDHMNAIDKRVEMYDTIIHNLREKLGAELIVESSDNNTLFEILRVFKQLPNLPLVDQVMIDACISQHEGKIEDAIGKWRFVANTEDGENNNLAARAWKSIGFLYLERNDLNAALTAYSKAIECNDKDAGAHYRRGGVHLRLEKYESSIEDCNSSLQLRPNVPEVLLCCARAKYALDRYTNAISDCNTAIGKNSNYAEAYEVRGEAKDRLEEFKTADVRADFQWALELAEKQENEDLKTRMVQRLDELNEQDS